MVEIQDKRQKYIVLVAALILLVGLLDNTYFYYKQTVIRITEIVNQEQSSMTGMNGKKENKYLQQITAKIMNGEYKGEIVTFTNKATASGVMTEKYKTTDTLFVKITPGENDNLKVSVIDSKRDTYIIILVMIFVVCLLYVSKKQGTLTIISLVLNVFMFYGLMNYYHLSFFNEAWIGVVAAFVVITLLCAAGVHKETFVAITASFISLGVIIALFEITIARNNDIPYELMEYVVTPMKLEKIFMASVIIGSLGAIVDVAITISSSVQEIILKSPGIHIKALIKSVREIGYDIMGTMINVLFFSYVSSSLPITILRIHSGYTLKSVVRFGYIFDMIRFLIGSIGIIITIPITGIIATLVCYKTVKRGMK